MRRSLITVFTCVALAAGALAGCGDDDEGSNTDTGSVATTTAGGADVVVDMKDVKYIPEDVTVEVGQTIKWTNSDAFAHTVTADDGEFDSGTVDGGGTFDYTAETAGEFPYFCEIHPNQKGTITVE